MTPELAGASRSEVEQKLNDLRDNPVDTRGIKDAEILPLYDFLINAKPEDHWFCSKADPVAREDALFLNRMFAYQNDRVIEWKARLSKMLLGCTDCVRAFDKAKEEIKLTNARYFAAFTKDVMRNFWAAFEAFEAQSAADALANANLADAQSPAVYLMLSKLASFKIPQVLKLLPSLASRKETEFWPLDPPPAGLFLLSLHEDDAIRSWSKTVLLNGTVSSRDNFTANHETILKLVVDRLSANEQREPSTKLIRELSSVFPFTNNLEHVWLLLSIIIRIAPAEVIQSMKIQHLVFTHLHDVGLQFSEILRCLMHVFRRLGSKVWDGESAEYPQVVFDSIKDNPSYSNMLLTFNHAQEKPWFLLIMLEFLGHVWESPIFGEVLLKFSAFACDELQHERFGDNRSVAMAAVAQIISAALQKAAKSKTKTQKQSLIDVLRIHSDIFVAVGFSTEYNKPQWSEARKPVLMMLRFALSADLDIISNTAVHVLDEAATITEEELKRLAPSIQTDLWRKVYKSLRSQDQEGLAFVIGLAARMVWPDTFREAILVKRIWKYHRDGNDKQKLASSKIEAAKALCRSVQAAMDETRSGLSDALTRFADMNRTSDMTQFVKKDGVMCNLLFLMFSPVPGLHIGAHALVGQIFDVDGRSDRFRQLFQLDLEASLLGLQEYLTKFNEYALKAIEACDLSKSLVRCLTDITDVLFGAPDALLKDEAFVKQHSKTGREFVLRDELLRLWERMTTAVAVIFKGTPRWATYFENKVMVEWMRDALIFARELLAQRKSLETAATIASGDVIMFEGEQKLSDLGKTIVKKLQDVLLELTQWLRLTDPELLHQSFGLLKSIFDCLREADMKPSPEATAKLNRLVEIKRKEAGQITILNLSQVLEIEVALANFESPDSDVEIISMSLQPQTESEKSRVDGRSSSPDLVSVDKNLRNEKDRAIAKSTKSAKRDKLTPGSIASSSKSKPEPPKPAKRPEQPLANRDRKIGYKFEGGKPSARSASSRSSAQEETSSSSSSDSDSADEKGRRGLARLAALQKPSPKKPIFTAKIPKYSGRQIKIIDDPMTDAYNRMSEKMRQAEEARRTQMRLKPDITPLHQTILSWDYDHNGESPPFQNMQKPTLVTVPESFKDHREYLRVFEPLLLYECWAQITKSKEESTAERYSCKIAGRTHVDFWLDLDLVITESVKVGWRLSPETDVVLLRNPVNKKSIMAKVTGFRPLQVGFQVSVRCCTRGHQSDPGLGMNAVWRLNLVFSLTTLHREFGALMALPYYEMADMIYRPRLANPGTADPGEVREGMKAYRLNEPQTKAIISALKTTGFSLIQGPPGTGKTSTICGLVGAFLSSRPRRAKPIVVGNNVPSAPAASASVGKILICAPSNAAIDELAKRLSEGVYNSRGERVSPKVVRVGAESSINVSTRDIALDVLVDKMLDGDGDKDSQEAGTYMKSTRDEIENIKKTRLRKEKERDAVVNDIAKVHALEEEIKVLNAQKTALSQKLDALRDKQKSNARTMDAARRKYRFEVLSDADIVCSTLSGAGHEQLETFDFEMVIIDEAAQAIELSSLIPLKYRSTRCVMVGDPQQLPPTVLSLEAAKWGYNQSLFVRLQKHNPAAVHLLSIQYRMHPQISLLPSRVFYHGKLQDGPDMDKKTAQPWHSDPRFGPYKFFSAVRGREESSTIGHSIYNREECHIIAAVYSHLKRQFPTINLDYRIGIVSMYRAQIVEIRKVFSNRFGTDILGKVDFSTVDGFQGQEKDIIILSCVRAGPSLTTVGFLADIRRMNVAITRARSSLFIVGNGPTLERSNDVWSNIVNDARERSCYVELNDLSYFTKNAPPRITNDEQEGNAKPTAPKRAKQAASAMKTAELPEQLLTPKEAKSKARQKLLKASETPSQRTNAVASSSSSAQKRTHEQDNTGAASKKARLADLTQQSEIQQPPAAGSSSSSLKRPKDKDHVPRPAPANQLNNGVEKQISQKELKKFKERRDKQANNLFIKR